MVLRSQSYVRTSCFTWLFSFHLTLVSTSLGVLGFGIVPLFFSTSLEFGLMRCFPWSERKTYLVFALLCAGFAVMRCCNTNVCILPRLSPYLTRVYFPNVKGFQLLLLLCMAMDLESYICGFRPHLEWGWCFMKDSHIWFIPSFLLVPFFSRFGVTRLFDLIFGALS